MEYVVAVVWVVLSWWLSTIAILYLDGLPDRTYRRSMLAGTALLGLGVVLLWQASELSTPAGALLGYTGALAVWGCVELSFLLGFITGPRRTACAAGCHGRAHFRHAVEAVLHHELAILVGAVLVLAVTGNGDNPTGTLTYLALWGMRTSAKLNLFLGVPNTAEELLPERLRYLRSFMRRKSMNLLFPLSVTAITLVAGAATGAAVGADSEYAAVEFTLLSSIIVLGLLEHWLLVLPLRGEALWRLGAGDRLGTGPLKESTPVCRPRP